MLPEAISWSECRDALTDESEILRPHEGEISEFARGLVGENGVRRIGSGHVQRRGLRGTDIGRRERLAPDRSARRTLEALKHVLAKMASRGREDLVRVRVDISDYRARRDGQLVERAQELARQVLETGHEVVTEPLPAAERRIIHRTLADHPEVKTQALGDGLVKRIWIGPRSMDVIETPVTHRERISEGFETPAPGVPAPPRREPAREALAPEAPARPAEIQDISSPTETWPEETSKAPAPEWGRKPKPAKGRRR